MYNFIKELFGGKVKAFRISVFWYFELWIVFSTLSTSFTTQTFCTANTSLAFWPNLYYFCFYREVKPLFSSTDERLAVGLCLVVSRQQEMQNCICLQSCGAQSGWRFERAAVSEDGGEEAERNGLVFFLSFFLLFIHSFVCSFVLSVSHLCSAPDIIQTYRWWQPVCLCSYWSSLRSRMSHVTHEHIPNIWPVTRG